MQAEDKEILDRVVDLQVHFKNELLIIDGVKSTAYKKLLLFNLLESVVREWKGSIDEETIRQFVLTFSSAETASQLLKLEPVSAAYALYNLTKSELDNQVTMFKDLEYIKKVCEDGDFQYGNIHAHSWDSTHINNLRLGVGSVLESVAFKEDGYRYIDLLIPYRNKLIQELMDSGSLVADLSSIAEFVHYKTRSVPTGVESTKSGVHKYKYVTEAYFPYAFLRSLVKQLIINYIAHCRYIGKDPCSNLKSRQDKGAYYWLD